MVVVLPPAAGTLVPVPVVPYLLVWYRTSTGMYWYQYLHAAAAAAAGGGRYHTRYLVPGTRYQYHNTWCWYHNTRYHTQVPAGTLVPYCWYHTTSPQGGYPQVPYQYHHTYHQGSLRDK